jgi:type II secretion system protein H
MACTQGHRRGFTLLELVVVVLIVGLATTIVVKSMSRALNASRASSLGQVVGADLERAFMLAALQRRPVRVRWDASGMNYTITDRRTNTVLLTRRIGSATDIGIASVTFSTTPVDIFPGGTASSMLRITLTAGSSSHVVTMTRSGLVLVN